MITAERLRNFLQGEREEFLELLLDRGEGDLPSFKGGFVPRLPQEVDNIDEDGCVCLLPAESFPLVIASQIEWAKRVHGTAILAEWKSHVQSALACSQWKKR